MCLHYRRGQIEAYEARHLPACTGAPGHGHASAARVLAILLAAARPRGLEMVSHRARWVARRIRCSSLCSLSSLRLFRERAAQYFGRNKVQYEKFDWKILKSDHFDNFFYPAGVADRPRRRRAWPSAGTRGTRTPSVTRSTASR